MGGEKRSRCLTCLSIRGFMFLIAGLVALFWLAGFLYSTARIREMHGLIQEVKNYDRPILEAGEKTLTAFGKVKGAFLMAFLTRDPAELEAARKYLSETRAEIAKTEELARKRNDGKILENARRLRELLAILEAELSSGKEAILNSEVNLSLELKDLLRTLNQSETRVYRLAQEMLKSRYHNLDLSLEKQRSLGRKMLAQNSILFGVSVFLALVLILWISGLLRAEARDLLKVAEAVGRKDLRVRVDLPERSSNEVHMVGRAVNQVISNLREFLACIQEGIAHISSASEEFSAVVTQNVEHSQQAFQNVKDLLDYTEKLKDQISEIKVSLDQLTEAVNEISRNATETSQESDQALKEVEAATEVLRQLTQEIQNISSSADLIQNIAEQTNLLALNATIEAARAGEAGKGFAVVANEVKELSRSSADSAKEIRDRVQALIARGREMEENMQRVLEGINRTRERTVSVASAVEEQTAVISEVAETLSQISERMGTLDRITEELRRRTEEAEQATADMKQGAEDLARTATLLQKEVQQYQVK